MNNHLHLKEDITVSIRCYSKWTHADTRKNRHQKLGNINQMLWRFRGEVYCLHSLQSSLNEQHMWSCRRLQPLTQENLLLLRTSVCLHVSHHKLYQSVMFSGNTKSHLILFVLFTNQESPTATLKYSVSDKQQQLPEILNFTVTYGHCSLLSQLASPFLVNTAHMTRSYECCVIPRHISPFHKRHTANSTWCNHSPLLLYLSRLVIQLKFMWHMQAYKVLTTKQRKVPVTLPSVIH